MKLSVRIRGEWIQVPCKDGYLPVQWLAEETLRRYGKLQPATIVKNKAEVIREVRKTRGGAILDPDDLLKDVIDDNDFLSVVLESDKPCPKTSPVEIHYIPEQICADLKQLIPLTVNIDQIIPTFGTHFPSPGNKLKPPDDYLLLDGCSLSSDDLVQLGKARYKIKLTKEAEAKVRASRDLVDAILRDKKIVYGITTGFGKFARVAIDKDKLEQLQVNLIRSHAAGVGNPLSPDKCRMLLALRINVLSKGHSGISHESLMHLIRAFNEKGTVGASGDLAPLAHLALGLMGEGKMWSPETGWGEALYVLQSHGLEQIKLKAKEGLAMINGTQMITSIGAEAVERAGSIAKQADVVAALTLEVLKGTSNAFDSEVHHLRGHTGQIDVARRLRALLHSETYPSEIAESHRFCNRVQDAYTLRCCPQVHGITHDTIDFVRKIITNELNAATDNPIVLADREEIISAGNFHGEYPAKVLDYLAIAVHELAAMSERRTERLVNPALSELPAFLVKDGGLNSGFMLAHCTAAALVSENKTLCHPASVDSISTSAGTEDHVSMGGFAARKALQVVENVEKVVAIELLAACQAIEFLRPLKTTVPLEEVYNVVRAKVRPWDEDRFMAPDIDAVTLLLQEEKIWNAVKHHVQKYHSNQEIETRVFSPTTTYLKEPLQRAKSKRNNRDSEQTSKRRRTSTN